AHWGLTELIAIENDALLALWRGYREPNQWWSRLELFAPIQLSAKTKGPLKPIAQWDLIGLGLAPDNWEAMAEGPRLGDGRSTLLLASDDNFNPLQANRLALLAPLRSASCGKGRP
ncbi:esterase-like activity of phytase family protein, partial [Synechococcus sp.]